MCPDFGESDPRNKCPTSLPRGPGRPPNGGEPAVGEDFSQQLKDLFSKTNMSTRGPTKDF
jgi:hypothetical protein